MKVQPKAAAGRGLQQEVARSMRQGPELLPPAEAVKWTTLTDQAGLPSRLWPAPRSTTQQVRSCARFRGSRWATSESCSSNQRGSSWSTRHMCERLCRARRVRSAARRSILRRTCWSLSPVGPATSGMPAHRRWRPRQEQRRCSECILTLFRPQQVCLPRI